MLALNFRQPQVKLLRLRQKQAWERQSQLQPHGSQQSLLLKYMTLPEKRSSTCTFTCSKKLSLIEHFTWKISVISEYPRKKKQNISNILILDNTCCMCVNKWYAVASKFEKIQYSSGILAHWTPSASGELFWSFDVHHLSSCASVHLSVNNISWNH